jgi:hypothetical protein
MIDRIHSAARKRVYAFAFAGLALGVAIGCLPPIEDKVFAAAVSGGILATFGAFIGGYINKVTELFPDLRVFFFIVILVAAVWFAAGA